MTSETAAALANRGLKKGHASAWDLTALLNAADPKATLAERHLWLIRLLEWLRHGPAEVAQATTPAPVLRIRHLLGVLERNPEHRAPVAELFARFLGEVDTAALLADFGFAPRVGLWGEFGRRVRDRLLPLTPATTDLAELFGLLFPRPQDAAWLEALDDATLHRLVDALAPGLHSGKAWREPFLEAAMFLASAVRAAGFAPTLRQRIDPELLVDRPFRQLARAAEQVREHAESGSEGGEAALLQQVQYMRALLETCRRCAASVHEHLEVHGVSVDVVFEVDQLNERSHRIEAVLNCIVSPEPAREILRLLAELVRAAGERRSLRALFSRHYSLLARKVAERSAETGEHYITRDRSEYREMLRAAMGGGAVLGVTTVLKFVLMALGLVAFWGGLAAGINYAVSFVIVQLLHLTIATKQPAMTAHAMAEKLGDVSTDAAVERFVDEVANLIRSQAAGIFGNVAAVVPVVLLLQWLWQTLTGAPLLDRDAAVHVIDSVSLFSAAPLYAAFTGVLLFASSLVAGYVENWFVWHRLDSAIAWNPRFIARLGAVRAQRWAAFGRTHISGFASNISLGLMLGLVPALAAFFGLPLDVRHVTLSAGQFAAALGSQGGVDAGAFWACVAGIAVIATLNVGVSFFLAFRVALRSRGIRLVDRSRIQRAIRARAWRRPLSFLLAPA